MVYAGRVLEYFGYFGYRYVGSYSGLGGSAERPRRGADDRTGSAAFRQLSLFRGAWEARSHSSADR